MLNTSEKKPAWLALAAKFKAQSISDRFLRLEEVKLKTRKSKSAIYREIAEGTFPAPVRVGKRAIAWRQSTIDAWMEVIEQAAMEG